MRVLVKEFDDKLTLDNIKQIVKDDVLCEKYLGLESVRDRDIVFYSKYDDDKDSLMTCTAFEYEREIEKITNNIEEEFAYNYDYYYLNNTFEKAISDRVNTIISGSSYGIHGIIEKDLVNQVNISMISQDLYYSIKGIYHICEKNEHIKKVILFTPYYYFYSDLSRVKNKNELTRIVKIYQKLYGDMHNRFICQPIKNILYESNVIDMQRLLDKRIEHKDCYFSEKNPRRIHAVKLWKSTEMDWPELSDEEKRLASYERCYLHNKSKTKNNAFHENKALYLELLEFCRCRGIKVYLIVPPATKYYREALYKGFKESFYDVVNEYHGDESVLDLFESVDFCDSDFVDMDHLNDTGADKLTKIILDLD